MSIAHDLPPSLPPHGERIEGVECDLDQLTDVGKEFWPNRWQFSHGIANIEPVGYQNEYSGGAKIGEMALYGVEMEDGSVYRVSHGRPTRQQIDIAKVETTAYGTQAFEGMNMHHHRRDMRMGYHAVLFSRETVWDQPLDQGRTAYNMALVTKELITADGTVDPVSIEATGISRGGMVALGMKAVTENMPQLGLEIPYFNVTAPCYPEAITRNKAYLGMGCEGITLFYHLMQLPKALLRKYPGTLDLNISAGIASARALTNGDAGIFTEHTPVSPEKTNGYVAVMGDDVIGMGKVWKKKFDSHPGVHVVDANKGRWRFTNGHLRVFSFNDFVEFEGRQQRLIDERNSNVDIKDIDYRYVSLGEPAPAHLTLV